MGTATAGRILIMPKGDYDASATYEMLDLVRYGGTSWLCKKECTNIVPSNDNEEYWQNMFDADAFIDAKIEEKIQAYMNTH